MCIRDRCLCARVCVSARALELCVYVCVCLSECVWRGLSECVSVSLCVGGGGGGRGGESGCMCKFSACGHKITLNETQNTG